MAYTAATGVTAALDNNRTALAVGQLDDIRNFLGTAGTYRNPWHNTMEIADILCVGDQLEFIIDNIFLADDSADCII